MSKAFFQRIRTRSGHQLLRFLIVGILNTAFGYGLYAALVAASLDPAAALLISTCGGVCFNFFTTGKLVFKSGGLNVFPRYILAYAFIYLINVALLKAMILLGCSPYLAQIILLPIIVTLTFLIMKNFVFLEQGK